MRNYKHTYVHLYIHTYIHTYIHIYIGYCEAFEYLLNGKINAINNNQLLMDSFHKGLTIGHNSDPSTTNTKNKNKNNKSNGGSSDSSNTQLASTFLTYPQFKKAWSHVVDCGHG